MGDSEAGGLRRETGPRNDSNRLEPHAGARKRVWDAQSSLVDTPWIEGRNDVAIPLLLVP
jgi:hypothetical protein